MTIYEAAEGYLYNKHLSPKDYDLCIAVRCGKFEKAKENIYYGANVNSVYNWSGDELPIKKSKIKCKTTDRLKNAKDNISILEETDKMFGTNDAEEFKMALKDSETITIAELLEINYHFKKPVLQEALIDKYMLKFLLDNGANPNACTIVEANNNTTYSIPMLAAAITLDESGQAFETLLAYGADARAKIIVKHQNEEFQTTLQEYLVALKNENALDILENAKNSSKYLALTMLRNDPTCYHNLPIDLFEKDDKDFIQKCELIIKSTNKELVLQENENNN